MKNCIYILFSFMLIFILSSCERNTNENIVNEDGTNKNEEETILPEEEGDSKLSVTINLTDLNVSEFYKDCYLNSIYDEVPVTGNSMNLVSEINTKVQTFYLTDGDDNIYMMSRVSDTKKNKEIRFDVESTALAFVTLNPFFAHIDSLAYDILTEVIIRNSHFSFLCNEVQKVINQKKDLYSADNNALINAFDTLLEDIIDLSIANIDSITVSRAIDDSENYYPFKLKTKDNVLNMQLYGLNPNYYGTATHANGNVENLIVYSHDDFGILDFMSNVWDVVFEKHNWGDKQWGEITQYTFPADGEYRFDFTCRTEMAEKELTLKILYSILDILGIPTDVEDMGEIVKGIIEDTVKELPQHFNDVVNNGKNPINLNIFPFCVKNNTDIEQLAVYIYNTYIDLMQATITKKKREILNLSISENLKSKFIKKYNATYKQLGATKKTLFMRISFPTSIANILGRILASATAKDEVHFDLCCYNNKIEVCNRLLKMSGDGQTGNIGEELELPLTVNAHIDFPDSPSNYMVKFTVEEGGGTLSEEEVDVKDAVYETTKWTLGNQSIEQKVKASLILKETGEEVCEPVYFTAIAKEVIYIISGNEQKGNIGKILDNPLTVGIRVIHKEKYSYKVKYEVVSGDGQVSENLVELTGYQNNYKTETYWKLGNNISQEQKVKAVLINSYTQAELTEPIYFIAYVESQAFTGEAIDITDKSAVVHGSYKGISADMEFGIIFYTDDVNTNIVKGTFNEGNSEYAFSLNNLIPDTEYYYKSYILVGDQYIYGERMNFKTLPKTYKFRFIAESSSSRFPDANEIFSVESEDYFFCDIKGYGIEYSKNGDLEHAWDEKKTSKLRISVSDDTRDYSYGAYQGGDLCVLWFYSNSFDMWLSPSLEVIYMVWASPVRRNKGENIKNNVKIKLERLEE